MRVRSEAKTGSQLCAGWFRAAHGGLRRGLSLRPHVEDSRRFTATSATCTPFRSVREHTPGQTHRNRPPRNAVSRATPSHVPEARGKTNAEPAAPYRGARPV